MRSYALRQYQLIPCPTANLLRRWGWVYLVLFLSLLAIGIDLLASTMALRARRDHALLALQTRLQDLEHARWNLALSEKLLHKAKQAQPQRAPYLVISLEDRRLWFKDGDAVLFTARVATGSGKTLAKGNGGSPWKFETPRGVLRVEGKEKNPVWVPPDWFYVEQARKKKLGLVRLQRGGSLWNGDGSVLKVEGANVVRVHPDGRRSIVPATEQKYIVASGRIVVPPMDTNQRRFDKVLGTHRLKLGSGYGLHGTNKPDTVGQAVSHGCVRLLNEDIARLYGMLPVGTRVYIY